jgi:hypothetical protein
MLRQVRSVDDFANDYILVLQQAIHIFNLRLEHRLCSEDLKKYENTELINTIISVFSTTYMLTTEQPEINLKLRSNINIDHIYKLQDSTLLLFSLLVEFPDTLRFILPNLYCHLFREINQRPAILFLLTSVLKNLANATPRNKTEIALEMLSKPYVPSEHLIKSGKASTVVNNSLKMFENVIQTFIFSTSPHYLFALNQYLDALLQFQEYSMNLDLYFYFDRLLKSLLQNIKEDAMSDIRVF